MTKTKKAKALCQTCQALHDHMVTQRKSRNANVYADFDPPRVTTAKWRVTYRDGVRFQQTVDLCAKHFTDVLDRVTTKAGTVGVTLNITKLR